MADAKMYRLSGFDSLSNRHATYQRLLEQLAQECEDHVNTLKGGDPKSVQWVIDRLQQQLDRIYEAGAPPEKRTEEKRDG